MKLLIVEDDLPFANTLSRRLTKHGFTCFHASNSNDALLLCHREMPEYILLDMNITQAQSSESGLALIKPMRSVCPDSYITLLTGFASIATAVDAIKLGANDYLSKPIDVKTLLAALNVKYNANQEKDSSQIKLQKQSQANSNGSASYSSEVKRTSPQAQTSPELMSADEAEWQHIQQTLKFNKGNISETARQLSMHRRTLQRKLQKRSPVKTAND